MMAVRNSLTWLKNRFRASYLWAKKDRESILKELTTLPGIGENNCHVFYDAGYKTKKSILSATDQELMDIPGVGVSFIKRLRESINRL